jgi:hypothetical protein
MKLPEASGTIVTWAVLSRTVGSRRANERRRKEAPHRCAAPLALQKARALDSRRALWSFSGTVRSCRNTFRFTGRVRSIAPVFAIYDFALRRGQGSGDERRGGFPAFLRWRSVQAG